MLQRLRPKRAQSVIEYMTLMAFILMAFLVFQKYIARGLTGRWKGSGDALGAGHIYDPKKTTHCAFDFVYNSPGIWYDKECFDEECDCSTIQVNCGSPTCETRHDVKCEACIRGCSGGLLTKC